jgi:hypothetical protein
MPDKKQRDHEKFTAEKIVWLCGEPAQLDRLGDPNQREPDTIFSGTDMLGIEVTTGGYQGNEEDPNLHIREQWKLIRKPKFDANHMYWLPKPKGQIVWDRMIERLTTSCQLRLDSKCSKSYRGVDRLWLGIYVVAPATEPHEHDQVAQNLVVPTVNPFARIFLLHRTRGEYRALQISPFISSFVPK